MKSSRAEEIAISFINGNISWVRQQLNTRQKTAAVANWIRENEPRALESFLRLMASAK